MRFDSGFTDFDSFPTGSTPAHISELDIYLCSPVESVKHPIKWWLGNKGTYPNLSCMALDYLSIPAISTSVERVFSQGRHLLHFTRNRLSASTIRSSLCLGSWCRNDLIITKDLVSAVASGKRKCIVADGVPRDASIEV